MYIPLSAIDFFYSDDTSRIKKRPEKTRGKGLEKLKRTLEKKMIIEILVGKERTAKKRCQVNKINRSKLKCNHIMGSKAFSVARAEINSMNDLKALYTSGESSMTIDEIVDVVLSKKLGYIKGLGYGPKPDTITATQRRAVELEDSL
ncbi:hypothetical protein FXO37_14243 [Capsicum annuum]|nr:hypothetical protein FXO37_14243 [Capsicum annuum]